MAWRGCGGLVSALARFAQHSNVTLQTISSCFLPKNTEKTLKLALVSSSAIACWRLSQNLVDSRVLLGAYLMSGTTTATIMTTNLITKSSFLFPQGGHHYYSTSSHYDKWTNLSYDDLQALIDCGDIQLFDVREPKEILDTGKIPCAINIPLGQIKDALAMEKHAFLELYQVDKPEQQDTNIVFVGLSHIKSSTALELAHRAGFKKARHYYGGYEEWLKKQQPAPPPLE